MDKPLRKYTREEGLQRLKSLCRTKEVSQKQAVEKLLSYGFSFSDSQDMLLELLQGKFVDDARFAGAFIHDKLAFSKWGKNKINQHLKKYGIAERTITFAWQKSELPSYTESLDALIEAKATKYQPQLSWENRNKFIRFLQGRGFEMGLILERLKIYLET